MKIEGKEYRTIWFENNVVKIIDQTKLPHNFIIKDLKTAKDAVNAIKVMEVRGAPLIGATAAYGLVLSILENNDQSFLKKTAKDLSVKPVNVQPVNAKQGDVAAQIKVKQSNMKPNYLPVKARPLSSDLQRTRNNRTNRHS